MKTYKYKTLKGLINKSLYNRISLDSLLSGCFYHKEKGYTKFTLPEDERKKAFLMLASVISSTAPARYSEYLENYSGQNYGIFCRLYIGRSGAHYCAGQNYTGEIRYIQNLLRKN